MRSRTTRRTHSRATVLFDAGHPDQIAAAKLAERIRRDEELAEALIAFHRVRHAELARQRAEVREALQAALLDARAPLVFDGWYRGIKLRYADHPFCTLGSTKTYGGRFNIGEEIDRDLFPLRPALYVAISSATAHAESSAIHAQMLGSPFSGEDLVLARAADLAQLVIEGALEAVVDLRRPRSLRGFVDIIKGFELPKHLHTEAKRLKIAPPRTVRNVDDLLKSVLARQWRVVPALCGIPANGQILGSLARDAGLQGIVYESSITSEPCVAIFPENLADSDSFVRLTNELPGLRGPRQLDRKSWKLASISSAELGSG